MFDRIWDTLTCMLLVKDLLLLVGLYIMVEVTGRLHSTETLFHHIPTWSVLEEKKICVKLQDENLNHNIKCFVKLGINP